MDVKGVIEITEFLFNKRLSAHIYTNEGMFYNGLILEFSKTMIVIKDNHLGDTPVLISDIKYIRRDRNI